MFMPAGVRHAYCEGQEKGREKGRGCVLHAARVRGVARAEREVSQLMDYQVLQGAPIVVHTYICTHTGTSAPI
jgi:hypothetical protein